MPAGAVGMCFRRAGDSAASYRRGNMTVAILNPGAMGVTVDAVALDPTATWA